MTSTSAIDVDGRRASPAVEQRPDPQRVNEFARRRRRDTGGHAITRSASSSTSVPPAATTTSGPNASSRTNPTDTSTPGAAIADTRHRRARAAAPTPRRPRAARPRRRCRARRRRRRSCARHRSGFQGHGVADRRRGGDQRPSRLSASAVAHHRDRRSRRAARTPDRVPVAEPSRQRPAARCRRAGATVDGQRPVRQVRQRGQPAAQCPRGRECRCRATARAVARSMADGTDASTASGASVSAATSSTASAYAVSPSNSVTRSTARAVTATAGSSAIARRQAPNSVRVSAPVPHTSSGLVGDQPVVEQLADRRHGLRRTASRTPRRARGPRRRSVPARHRNRAPWRSVRA